MSDVEVERSGSTAVLRLNRPERRNAVGGELFGLLIESLEAADADPQVRAVVTTGTGPSYCVGADLGILESLSGRPMDLGELGPDGVGGRTGNPVLPPHQRRLDHLGMGRWVSRFLEVGVPTVAAVNGAAGGGGLVVALLHDVRVMASDAKLAVGFNSLGFAPEMGVTWLLPRMIGQTNAFRVLTTTRPIGAEEALALGLVEQVVEPEDLRSAALARAEEFAAMPDRYVRSLKRLLRQGWETPLVDQLEREWTVQRSLFADDRAGESVAAVLAARARR